jgi:hypothetical protein
VSGDECLGGHLQGRCYIGQIGAVERHGNAPFTGLGMVALVRQKPQPHLSGDCLSARL